MAKNILMCLADILSLKVGVHIIFYQKIKGSKIEIARILHSRMDLNSRMEE
jgi:toxin ParE1/3/4